MANVIIVLILVAAVGYGIYSFIHHLRHGGGCCGEHDAPAKKVRAADTNKSHYPHRLVMGVDGMTCQNCQRHVENALNTLPDTLAEVNLSARNVMIWTKADAAPRVQKKRTISAPRMYKSAVGRSGSLRTSPVRKRDTAKIITMLASSARNCSTTFHAMYRLESPIIEIRRLLIIISGCSFLYSAVEAGTYPENHTFSFVRSGR